MTEPARRPAPLLAAPKARLVAFALTPGYETYKGLGWYGCIQQRGPDRASRSRAA